MGVCSLGRHGLCPSLSFETFSETPRKGEGDRPLQVEAVGAMLGGALNISIPITEKTRFTK